MSNENDETCVGCLLRVLFWFVVCSLIFVWCNRTDDKDSMRTAWGIKTTRLMASDDCDGCPYYNYRFGRCERGSCYDDERDRSNDEE